MSVVDQILEEVDKAQTPIDAAKQAEEATAAAAKLAEDEANKKLLEEKKMDDNGNPIVAEAAAPKEKTDATPAATEQPDAQPVDDIDDAKLLAAIQKRGLDIKSIDDLKVPVIAPVLTAEEQIAQEEKTAFDAIAFGINNKKFSPKEVEALNVDKARNPRDTAKMVFEATQKSLTTGITQEDIDARFAEWTCENEADDYWQKGMRQQEMQTIHSNYINSKYGNILGITGEYKQAVALQSRQQEYNANVDKAIASISDKLEFKIPTIQSEDGKTEEVTHYFTVSKDDLKAIEADFKKQETFLTIGKDGVDTKNLQQAILLAYKERNLDKIIAATANSHASHQIATIKAGLKGIQPQRIAEAAAVVIDDTAQTIDSILYPKGKPTQ